MLRTIFFWPEASSDFTFSRSALLSSPSTMRPSIAITSTPSTTRSVIFKATVHPPDESFPGNLDVRRRQKAASIIVRARQVIPALPANQLASFRLQPLGTSRAEAYGMLRGARLLAGVRLKCITTRGYVQGSFHGPKVIAQPEGRGKGGGKGRQ